MVPESRVMKPKVLVAGVGNVLRGDDGFGVAVAERLIADGCLPSHVDIVETGIGGVSLVQQLMDGYQAFIVVDATDRGAEPGTVFVIEPHVPDVEERPSAPWHDELSDLHLVEPSRVFTLAKALGVLPETTWLVGCQPYDCDELAERLSPKVQSAVDVAIKRIRELIDSCAG